MPSNITDCQAPLINSTFFVVCSDPTWDEIRSDQIPSNANRPTESKLQEFRFTSLVLEFLNCLKKLFSILLKLFPFKLKYSKFGKIVVLDLSNTPRRYILLCSNISCESWSRCRNGWKKE